MTTIRRFPRILTLGLGVVALSACGDAGSATTDGATDGSTSASTSASTVASTSDPATTGDQGTQTTQTSQTTGDATGDATVGTSTQTTQTSQTTDEPTSGVPLPEPVGTIGELLVPFDTNGKDLEGPPGWSPQYGKSPEIVPMVHDRVIDVLVQDYANGPTGHAYVLRLEPLDADYVITAAVEPPMLDRIMGFARDPNDMIYVASGVDEQDTLTLEVPAPGEYRSGIVRVVKQGWDGAVAFDTDLDKAREATGQAPELLINPMVAGTSRLAWGADSLSLVHGNNTDTDWNINARHQKAITTHLDAGTGEVTRVASIWVSHSFDQRLFHDGTAFVEMHLGDAFPREVVFAHVKPDSDVYSLLAIKGDLGNNNTFTRLGNAVMIEDDPTYGYLALFATESTSATDAMVAGSRELGVVRVRRDFFDVPAGEHLDPSMPDTFDVQSSGKARTNRLRWLTSYQADTAGQSHAERPKLVALGDDTFVVLWERWDANGGMFTGTWGMVIDAAGTPLVPAGLVSDSHLPRGDDAFALAGEAAWITGDAAARQLHIHVVDATLAYRRIIVE